MYSIFNYFRKVKKLKSTLYLTEARFNYIAENFPDVIWMQDLSFNTVYMSPSIKKQLGYTVEEYLSMPVSKRLPEESVLKAKEVLMGEMDKLKKGEIDKNTHYKVFEMLHRHKNGRTVWGEVTMSFIWDSNSKPIGIQGITRNIHEKKIAEIALESNFEKFKSLYNNNNTLLLEIDKRGLIAYANNNFLQLCGYTKEEVLGMHFLNYIDSSMHKIAIERFKCKFNKPDSDLNEYIILAKDGTKKWVNEYSNTYKSSDGEIYLSLIAFDITHRKELELKLTESNAQLEALNAAKDRFYNIIAHDLRHPFQSILGFSELMLTESLQTIADYRTASNSIYKTSQQAFLLLENLLDWTKLQGNNILFSKENLSVRDLFEDVTEFYKTIAQFKNVELIIEGSTDLYIHSDKHIALTVLRNIVSNAIKFTLNNSKVVLKGEMRNNDIIIMCIDEGEGIANSVIDKILNQTINTPHLKNSPEQGSGWGLMLCKDLLDKMGGKIWFETEAGRGSKFYISFPSATEKYDVVDEAAKVIIERKNILVTDDEELNYVFYKEVLNPDFYNLIYASNAEQAFIKLSSEKIDLVLMDIQMPGIDGIEAAHHIKKLYPHIPIVAQSSLNLGEIEEKLAKKNDFCSVLTKPISIVDLKKTIFNQVL